MKTKKSNLAIHYLRRNKKFPTVWCPGCGNGIIFTSLIRAIDSLKVSRNKIVLVSGIGCSSRAPVYADFNTLHTTHGRAIPFATGVKMANPDLKVIVVTGDGDCLAIGGNHFIHACRRNIDITVILFNNWIYGMTGGQFSPTTFTGDTSKTSPYGNLESAFDPCALAVSAGAGYVARSTVYHVPLMDRIITKAITRKNFSFVEVVTQCHTQYGKQNKKGSAVEMMRHFKDNSIQIKGPGDRRASDHALSAEEFRSKIQIGEFADNDNRGEYLANYQACVIDKAVYGVDHFTAQKDGEGTVR